jgi:hypothetical protein
MCSSCHGGASCCTVTIRPGGDIQAGLDSLPPQGGCVCLKTGLHEITAPLRITQSNVYLHGESPGTIVRRSSGPLVLHIESDPPGLQISDVIVEGIDFETTSELLPDDEYPAVIVLKDCADITLLRCAGLSAAPAEYIGLYIEGSDYLSVEECEIRNTMWGIWVHYDSTQIRIHRNNIHFPSSSAGAFSFLGIFFDALYGPAYVTENRITGYMGGIVLNNHALNPSQMPNSEGNGSFIARNKVTTTGTLAFLPLIFFGIDVAANDCVIADNRVTYQGGGGIWVTGSGCDVRHNHVKLTDDPALAVGICVGHYFDPVNLLDTQDFVPDVSAPTVGGRIKSNTITGPQLAIFTSNNTGAIIENNSIESSAGIFTVWSDRQKIVGNQISASISGLILLDGIGCDLNENAVTNSGFGLIGGLMDSFSAVRNRFENVDSWGALLLMMTGSTLFNGNRLISTGYGAGAGSLATGLTMIDVDGYLEIGSNEVLNTGVGPSGEITAGVAYGIAGVKVSECSIHSNFVGYSDPSTLDAALEHRALYLTGPPGIHVDLASGDLDVGFGSAQVLGNKFNGPGFSALVEIAKLSTDPNAPMYFDRIAFSNNYCNHINGAQDASRATVSLNGGSAIVQGNQFKSNTTFFAVNFNGSPGVYSGNISMGGTTQFTAFPVPEANYNLIV